MPPLPAFKLPEIKGEIFDYNIDFIVVTKGATVEIVDEMLLLALRQQYYLFCEFLTRLKNNLLNNYRPNTMRNR